MGSVCMAIQFGLTSAGVSGFPILASAVSSLAGWTVFGIAVFRTRSLNSTEAGRAFLAQAVTDERLAAIRNRAFTNGFAAVVVLQAIFLVAPLLIGDLLNVTATASLTIAVGVTVALLSYHRFQDHE